MKNHRPRLLSPRILAPLLALSFSPLVLAQALAASDNFLQVKMLNLKQRIR